MREGLSVLQRRLAEWQQRRGTRRVVLLATLVSCVVSCVITYSAIAVVYGVGNVFDAEPVMLWLPLLVPLMIAPAVTFQLATTLETASSLIEELSTARTRLENEVAARKVVQDELEFLALRDPLTGLLNRRGFFDELDALTSDQLSRLVVATIDVDDFKMINDTFGHPTGDSVLREVGHRLRDVAGQDAIVARLGGDEFAVALVCGGDATTVQDELSSFEVVASGGTNVEVRCSVGIAVHSLEVSIDTTLLQADGALYREKSERALPTSPIGGVR